MNKKEYIKPSIMVTDMELKLLDDGSLGATVDGVGTPRGSVSDKENDEGGSLSKENDVWSSWED